MISPALQHAIEEKLSRQFQLSTGNLRLHSVGGGSINQTYKLSGKDTTFFCKINSATKFPHLFRKESEGLNLIKKQGIIKVPGVIDCFEEEGQQVLLLEWIDAGERTEEFWEKFGQQLAALHHITHDQFGLNEDNYMGSVAQSNRSSNNWIEFFIWQRLDPLIGACAGKKLLTARHQQQFENLYKHLPQIFDGKQKPALLHGDLWSGNYMCGPASDPVLIDPAVYYGHPSVDLGMTTLFGGFRSSFYEAYHFHSPFPANYEEQWQVCNLYPLLIHLYLFGSSYLAQLQQTLQKF